MNTQEIEIIGDNHVGSSVATPLLETALTNRTTRKLKQSILFWQNHGGTRTRSDG